MKHTRGLRSITLSSSEAFRRDEKHVQPEPFSRRLPRLRAGEADLPVASRRRLPGLPRHHASPVGRRPVQLDRLRSRSQPRDGSRCGSLDPIRGRHRDPALAHLPSVRQPALKPAMDGSTVAQRLDISHWRILSLALPMTLSHVTTPLLGLVDATVIGRLGEAHLLGAVALGAVIFDFLFWSFGSLRMATAGLTAQATGAGSPREVELTVARALAVALLVGAAMILGQSPIGFVAFRLAGASEAATEALRTYFFIRIWS